MDEPLRVKNAITETNLLSTVDLTTISKLTGIKNRPKWHRVVGNTTFTESRNIANLIPCERLYLKFEGNNPTGTQKDRIAFAVSDMAKNNGYTGITTATCGNYGAALAYAADYFKIPETHIYIPQSYHVPKKRLETMLKHKAQIHYVEGTYEHAVEYSCLIAKENGWFDANAGSEQTLDTCLGAYAEIGLEIYRSLRRVPDYILCPVGNGTTLTGIYYGFRLLLELNKIQEIPRMVAVSTRRGNPIIKSFKLKSQVIMDLSPTEIKETKINEPLTNWHSYDGQIALNVLYETNGFAEYASDTKMFEFARHLKTNEGLNVHPASASTLAVLANLTKNNMPLKGSYVAVLTGREM